MKPTIEQKIQQTYDELFDFLCKEIDEDLYDLVIEFKDLSGGKTIRISWKDREERLQEGRA